MAFLNLPGSTMAFWPREFRACWDDAILAPWRDQHDWSMAHYGWGPVYVIFIPFRRRRRRINALNKSIGKNVLHQKTLE
jgi:hypothetical protein